MCCELQAHRLIILFRQEFKINQMTQYIIDYFVEIRGPQSYFTISDYYLLYFSVMHVALTMHSHFF